MTAYESIKNSRGLRDIWHSNAIESPVCYNTWLTSFAPSSYNETAVGVSVIQYRIHKHCNKNEKIKVY